MVSKRNKGKGFGAAIAVGCVSCVLAVGIGFGVATAGILPGDDDTFGIGSAQAFAEGAVAVAPAVSASSDGTAAAHAMLATRVVRDISAGIDEMEQRLEAERIAAEEAARAAERAHIAEVTADQDAHFARYSMGGLSKVDWSVGKEAFIAEWTTRIDAYLEGSPLAGYGSVFATAAWENGMDPRWSPAISNTESSKGSVCFKYHNAWGWGNSSWATWEDAINAHVAGLARGYGYSITLGSAEKYCPPNYVNWFNNTLSEMKRI